MTNSLTTSAARDMIAKIIERECAVPDTQLPAGCADSLPEPVKKRFLVLRGAAMHLWIVVEKENDPDRKVIVFDSATKRFGVAVKSIQTLPGDGFMMGFCNSFEHAVTKAGILL
jgi:hypothetical protein